MNKSNGFSQSQSPRRLTSLSGHLPPQFWFFISSVFHYLGPSFAVLLFPLVGVFGIAWYRITTAALFFAPAIKPWSVWSEASPTMRFQLLALGACLALMNTAFYLALARLPISLVAAMEFVGMIGIALYGSRTWRNVGALLMATFGLVVLLDVELSNDPIGLFWSGLNMVLFACYVILGHRASEYGASGGVERLGTAMAIAALFYLPFGFLVVNPTLMAPWILLAGAGVGFTSSVVPYVCDQLAMARLPRASFALMTSIMPVMAVLIGALVLAQVPSGADLFGIALISGAIIVHRPAHS